MLIAIRVCVLALILSNSVLTCRHLILRSAAIWNQDRLFVVPAFIAIMVQLGVFIDGENFLLGLAGITDQITDNILCVQN